MELILKEIERALDAKLYYLALQASLTLPDICGALQSNDGVAKKHKYMLGMTLTQKNRAIYLFPARIVTIFVVHMCIKHKPHTKILHIHELYF